MMVAKILVFIAIAVAGFGSAVLFLWNWLMPEIFGLHPINFGQALGLIGLSWILFRAGFIGGGGHAPWGRRRRWERMTPEERERFRRGMRCGERPPAPAPGE